MTIEEFWRTGQGDPSEELFKTIDITGSTTLMIGNNYHLIGMEDGTMLLIQGAINLKTADVVEGLEYIRCAVPSNSFPKLEEEFPVAALLEDDVGFFKDFMVNGWVQRFAFVPKVKRWFSDKTRRVR